MFQRRLSLSSPAPSIPRKARYLALLFPLGKEDELNLCQENIILHQKKYNESEFHTGQTTMFPLLPFPYVL